MKYHDLKIIKLDDYTEIYCSNVSMILYLKSFLLSKLNINFEDIKCIAHKGIIFDVLTVKKDVFRIVVKEILSLKWEAVSSKDSINSFRKEYEE